MKNTKILTIAALALLTALGTACGGVNGPAPLEAPKVVVSESAAPSASPSPSASETKKAVVPPATKAVVTDGTSSWMQTTFDETDADWLVDTTALTDADKAKVNKAKLQAAWESAATYIAEQGIDSELRTRGAEANPEVFNKWVKDNAPKWVAGKEFVQSEASKGNFLSYQAGIQQDDPERGITYGTGSKPRILERNFVLTSIEMNDASTQAKFNVRASYTMAYKNSTGADFTKPGGSDFVITVVDEGGEWKIKSNSGTFRPL